MALISTNPVNEKVLGQFEEINSSQIETKIENSFEAWKIWKNTSFAQKAGNMEKLIVAIEKQKQEIAKIITLEMGMPISQSQGEIDKTIDLIKYYVQNSEEFLKDEMIETEYKKSYISYESLGPILHIAPWNFPFYLALRPVIPAIMAGNTVLIKHASNVPLMCQKIQEIFDASGFEKNVMQTLLISSKSIENIIKNPKIAMVTLIGSGKAGKIVASTAASQSKQTVMELGGSDPFIVFEDADLEKIFPAAMDSRFRNCGQSCNSAKRFIVSQKISQKFADLMLKNLEEKQVFGDSIDPNTNFGPLATKQGLQDIERQVEESVKMGAKVLTGGHDSFSKLTQKWQIFKQNNPNGFYYPPTILTDVTAQMPVMQEETFGPVASIYSFRDKEEALEVANSSIYGLGASLWTQNLDFAKEIIPKIESGNVFVNSMVRSHIKMPYGGIKESGYGREMGEIGLKSFCNIKTVVFN